MKTTITTLMLLFFSSLFVITNAQIIYVDSASTAQNPTGESWDEAFQELQDALAAVPVEGDEIWVAQGTYTPDTMNGDTFATFFIADDIVLLGGFNGTEDSVHQRNPQMYETILSGDLNGDDEPGNFNLNKSDNTVHVVTVEEAISNDAVIDGFTIQGGYTDDTPFGNGGGIACWGEPIIRNCLFTDNSSHNGGGGLWFRPGPTGMVYVENCQFIGNQSKIGAGMNVRFRNIAITDCLFENNSTWDSPSPNSSEVGGGLFTHNSNCVVTNCSFVSNVAQDRAGGFNYWINEDGENLSLEMDGCTFSQNTSSDGGGFYPDVSGQNSTLTITGCEFLENSAETEGGGLKVFTEESAEATTILLDSCHFEQNTVQLWTGGGFRATLTGSENNFTISNSVCTKNSVGLGGAGGAIINYGDNSNGMVEVLNCSFIENEAEGGFAGLVVGSILDAGEFEYTVSNCQLIDNNSGLRGGGMGILNTRPSKYLVEDCDMQGNQAADLSGGFHLANTNSETEILVSRCVMRDNESAFGSGIGTLPIVEDPANFMVTNEADIRFENCLIAENLDGAAIGLKQTGDVKFINCTVANNQEGGIQLDSTSVATIQNTILYNLGGTEYEILPMVDDASITSIGGNLIRDGSLGTAAHPNDKENADPLFVSASDFHLQATSPAVDSGVWSVDLPEYDLDGNDRVFNCVDIGAFESEYEVSDECLTNNREIVVSKSLIISPNPVMEYLMVQFPEAINQPVMLSLFDAQGILIDQMRIDNGESIDVVHLPPGMYLLKGVNDNTTYTAKFIKQ